MARRQKYTVTADGKPACFQRILPILDVEVLMPAHNPDLATVFPGEKSAEKAVAKTTQWINKLKGSMVDSHPKLQGLLKIKRFNLVGVIPR